MIKLENYEVVGWEHAIRGMRNPLNSWDKSDSEFIRDPDYGCSGNCPCEDIDGHCDCCFIGSNDLDLMKRLRNAGTDHRKFMRMITVYVDITAPLYWWKEFKTYRAGRKFGDLEPDVFDPELLEMDIETNSCSTMHKIHEKEFTLEDFSHENLDDIWRYEPEVRDMAPTIEFETHTDKITNYVLGPDDILNLTIKMLNRCRDLYLKTKEKTYWWQMIQLLPSSYNQKRTVMLNYEVLANIYKSRKNHKLDEWKDFCKWISSLPYSELITGESNE